MKKKSKIFSKLILLYNIVHIYLEETGYFMHDFATKMYMVKWFLATRCWKLKKNWKIYYTEVWYVHLCVSTWVYCNVAFSVQRFTFLRTHLSFHLRNLFRSAINWILKNVQSIFLNMHFTKRASESQRKNVQKIFFKCAFHKKIQERKGKCAKKHPVHEMKLYYEITLQDFHQILGHYFKRFGDVTFKKIKHPVSQKHPCNCSL